MYEHWINVSTTNRNKKDYNNEPREKKCGRFHRGRKKEQKNYYVLGNQCSVLTQYSPLNDFN